MVNIMIILITLLASFLLIPVFKKTGFTKQNYKKKLIPYSGGTVIFLGIVISYVIIYAANKISYFKMIFFIFALSGIYAVGMADDVFGDRNIKGIKNNLASILYKRFSMGIAKVVIIVGISCYIYYFFNEEYWFLKGILTALITNFFNLLDLRPGRCIKFYFVLWIALFYANLRWTGQLYNISFLVLAAYYYFDAFGYSMLGDSGANLIGFILGIILSEAISNNVIMIILLIILLTQLQLLFDRFSFTDIISKFYILDYFDRFLTERQAADKDVKP